MGASSPSRRRGRGPLVVALLALGAVGGAAWWYVAPDAASVDAAPTWKVVRGPLRISVTEGGSLQSLKSATIVSEVEGETKIVAIVPEGTVLTADDVEKGRVLVELDSSEIRNKLNRQEISVSDAQAGVVQATGALDIQVNQGASDVRKADLDVRFARLDLDKYLGAAVAEKVLASRSADGRRALPDLKALAEDPAIEGEALQSERKLKSEIDLADEEVSRARQKLAGTQTLLAKGYVSQDELVADKLALKRQEVALDQAKTAIALFTTYEFPKEVEKLWSDLLEAEETLGRVRKQADSARSQAEAELRGRQEKLRLEKDQFAKLERQLAACVIKATTPGLVVYASSEDRGDWHDGQPIQQGTSIRERQAIISIPDATRMGVRVNVHESALDKVRVGQTVSILVDAYADRPFAGRIEKLGTMPNAANRWQNPDLKVYATDIVLESPLATLRPGMSAKVEILVKELDSTLAVPVQAVGWTSGTPAVWVRRGDAFEPHPVRQGLSNERFVEILDGIAEGDVVSLAPPKEAARPGGNDAGRKGGPGGKGGRPKEGAPAAAAGAGMAASTDGAKPGGMDGGMDGSDAGPAAAPTAVPAPGAVPGPNAAPAADAVTPAGTTTSRTSGS